MQGRHDYPSVFAALSQLPSQGEPRGCGASRDVRGSRELCGASDERESQGSDRALQKIYIQLPLFLLRGLANFFFCGIISTVSTRANGVLRLLNFVIYILEV